MKTKQTRRFRPSFDALEDRCLMASGVTASLSLYGILTVNGTEGADLIGVGQSGGQVQVVTRDQTVGTFNASRVNAIFVYGRGGDDFIILASKAMGADALNITSVVEGGDGNDTLVAAEGGSQMVGGAGNDLLIGQAGADIMDGGAGNDTLYGLGGGDFLFGGDGDDKLYGGDGNDYADGGYGWDELYGEAGDDWLFDDALGGKKDGGAGQNQSFNGHMSSSSSSGSGGYSVSSAYHQAFNYTAQHLGLLRTAL